MNCFIELRVSSRFAQVCLVGQETVWVAPKPKANKPPVAIKRGARCVDEEVEVVEKKSRPSKRDAGSIKDAAKKLHSEAMAQIGRLNRSV